MDNNLVIYAKEEAVAAVLRTYHKSNISIYITALYDSTELGGHVEPSGTFTVQRTEANRIVNDTVKYITLRYRMGINNEPVVNDKDTQCILSFSGLFRNTIVRHIDVISISLLDEPAHQISFPYLDLPVDRIKKEDHIKKEEPIKKKNSFLRVIK